MFGKNIPFPARLHLLMRVARRLFIFLCALTFGLAVVSLISEVIIRVYASRLHDRLYVDQTLNEDDIGKKLILCAGDSYVFGIGAPRGLDYPHQFEQLLNMRFGEEYARVVNVGRSGYNTSQAVNDAISYMRTNKEKPDLVIFQAGVNNPHNYSEARFGIAEASRPGFFSMVKYMAADVRMFHVLLIVGDRIERLFSKSLIPPGATKGLDHSKVRLLQKWIRRDIEELHRYVSRDNAKMVLVGYWHTARWVEDVYREYAASHSDVIYIDTKTYRTGMSVLTAFRIFSTPPDWHPNQYGYARIAEIVYHDLVDQGWLIESEQPSAQKQCAADTAPVANQPG